MSRNYELMLRVLRNWPVDTTKGTRCYGHHLRELARRAFPTGNLYSKDEAENNKKLHSLLRLSENRYANKYPHHTLVGASGDKLEQISVILGEDYVNKFFTRSDN